MEQRTCGIVTNKFLSLEVVDICAVVIGREAVLRTQLINSAVKTFEIRR